MHIFTSIVLCIYFNIIIDLVFEIKKILVTGGAGNVGSLLVPRLLKQGLQVTVLDRFFFGREPLKPYEKNPRLNLIKDDTRWFDSKILKNVDAVIDLAAVSNDPAGEIIPKKTMEINYKARERVAKLSKKHGIKHYILASSCSTYGNQKKIVDENSALHPITVYAKANKLAENAVKKLANEKFKVTILRFATIFGLSRRVRFDIAVNGMVLGLYEKKEIPIMKDGTQWRPFIHIKDVVNAYILVLNSPPDNSHYQIFNVGSDSLNYQILPLAKKIADSINIPLKKRWYGDPDLRSYRVSFKKINSLLGFQTKYSISDGANEIYDALLKQKIQYSKIMKTVEWYRYLLESKKLVDSVEINNKIL